MFTTFFRIVKKPSHLVFIVFGMLVGGIAAIVASNWKILSEVYQSSLPKGDQLIFFMTLFHDPVGTYGMHALIFFALVDFLFVFNGLILYRLFKEKFFLSGRGMAVNMMAFLGAVIGLGCFSCGSVLLVFVLSVFGASAGSVFAETQPWITAASIILFVLSIFLSLRKLAQPNVC